MLLIPAIDLKDAQCVHAQQGNMAQANFFSDNPLAVAKKWIEQGARRLHLVDLNGAHHGETKKNKQTIVNILEELGNDIPIQLGGGIRDLDTIEYWLDHGLSYVVIGTAAVQNPGFLQNACSAFGGHIIVAIDAKDGKVATHGWSKLTGHAVIDLAKRYQDYGVETIIYTDIGHDGKFNGINIDATIKLAQSTDVSIIASGGLASLSDIDILCAAQNSGISGIICNHTIYSGELDFITAKKHVQQLSDATLRSI